MSKIFYYSNDFDKFRGLLIRLRKYRFQDDIAIISFYNNYEFKQINNRIEIKKNYNKSKFIWPKFLAVVVFVILTIFLSQIKHFTPEIITILFIMCIFWLGLLKVINYNSNRNNYLHIFDFKNKVYIDNFNNRIDFDSIYGFFINYGRLHYQLNMMLNNGKVYHIITQEIKKDYNRTVNGIFIPILEMGDTQKIVNNITTENISDEYHNMSELIDNAIKISQFVQKNLYDFKGENIRKF